MELFPPPDHERLFDEICVKLRELENRAQPSPHQLASQEQYQQRLEAMQIQLKRSQEELKFAQQQIEERIKSLDSLSFTNNDLSKEVKRLSEQLEQERINNSKASTDLAKSLELNLKLQFEIQEQKTKANQALTEEKKHNAFLTEKNKTLTTELELAQALCNETRVELAKAKEKFSAEINKLLEENEELNKNITELEAHTLSQHEMMKNLSEVAEKKMVELKLALDKKTAESHDYYSHLQQAMTQINVLRQESAALREYVAKLSSLHQQQQQSRG